MVDLILAPGVHYILIRLHSVVSVTGVTAAWLVTSLFNYGQQMLICQGVMTHHTSMTGKLVNTETWPTRTCLQPTYGEINLFIQKASTATSQSSAVSAYNLTTPPEFPPRVLCTTTKMSAVKP